MTPNHRKRLTKEAGKRGILVKGVSNWHQLAAILSVDLDERRDLDEGPRSFCFRVMKQRGWVSGR